MQAWSCRIAGGEPRVRLQLVLKKHVDACLADVPQMPSMDIAGIIVDYLHLPYDVPNYEHVSEDHLNVLLRSGASAAPAPAPETQAAKAKPALMENKAPLWEEKQMGDTFWSPADEIPHQMHSFDMI